jgi:hypothetical protein
VSDFFERVALAFKCFFLVLFAGRLPSPIPARYMDGVTRAGSGDAVERPERAEPARATPGRATPAPPARPPAADAPPDRAVQLLALFQRDGRLVDFLREDLTAYPDDQVGAAVRELHASCRDVLDRYVGLEPVIAGTEGQPTVVERGFDPACVKLVGAVTGEPPFRGILRHRGWRADRVNLPPLPSSGGSIVAPAEVELG